MDQDYLDIGVTIPIAWEGKKDVNMEYLPELNTYEVRADGRKTMRGTRTECMIYFKSILVDMLAQSTLPASEVYYIISAYGQFH